MYDVTAIKESVDLVALAGHDTRLRKVAASEFAGPCPRCGGDDRLHVTPTWWFCRQCHDKRGDAIEYVQWRDRLAFAQACERLGGAETTHTGTYRAAPDRPRETTTPAIRPTQSPSPAWQERARAFVTWAQGQLWQTPAALDYLHGRGLVDDVIRAAGLGWNDVDWSRRGSRTMRREAWGLEPDPEKPFVFVPRGWVIPAELGGVLYYVKVRRPDGTPGDKVRPTRAWGDWIATATEFARPAKSCYTIRSRRFCVPPV